MRKLAYMQINNPVLKSEPVITVSLIHSVFWHFTRSPFLSYFTVIAISSIDGKYKGMQRTVKEKNRTMLMFLISYAIIFSKELM